MLCAQILILITHMAVLSPTLAWEDLTGWAIWPLCWSVSTQLCMMMAPDRCPGNTPAQCFSNRGP